VNRDHFSAKPERTPLVHFDVACAVRTSTPRAAIFRAPQSKHTTLAQGRTFCKQLPPFALSVAVSAAKSKSPGVVGLVAFDFAALLRNKMPAPHHTPWIPAEVYPELVEGLE
jgi:hypothetical protein